MGNVTALIYSFISSRVYLRSVAHGANCLSISGRGSSTNTINIFVGELSKSPMFAGDIKTGGGVFP